MFSKSVIDFPTISRCIRSFKLWQELLGDSGGLRLIESVMEFLIHFPRCHQLDFGYTELDYQL